VIAASFSIQELASVNTSNEDKPDRHDH